MKQLKLDTQMKPALSPKTSSDFTSPVAVGGDIKIGGQDVIIGHATMASEPSDLFPYLKSLNRK